MSYQNYERAMELAKSKAFYTTAGGKSEIDIAKAEEMLGVKFSKQYRDFNSKYAYLSFWGNEIFGIDPDNMDELEGNSLAYALNDREEYGLPYYLVPICNFDDGCMAYLNYSSLNNDGEPCVVAAVYNGSEFEIMESLAEDFGDFVLHLVKNAK